MYLPWRPTVVGLMYSAALAIVVAPKPAAGQPAQPKGTVTVVNTEANPVPVTGAVTGEITVTNSVLPVEVLNADPIPVSVAPSATRTPFQTYGSCVMPPDFDRCAALDYTVPGDKLLVIEMISLSVTVPPGQWPIFDMFTFDNPFRGIIEIPLQGPPAAFTGNARFSALHLLRFYVDPGKTVILEAVRRESVEDVASTQATISGYLVDCSSGEPCPLP